MYIFFNFVKYKKWNWQRVLFLIVILNKSHFVFKSKIFIESVGNSQITRDSVTGIDV